MKKIIILSLLFLVEGMSSGNAENIDAVRNELLKKSSFESKTYSFKTRNIGYLMGNSEYGSIIQNSGVGFNRTWFAGYWRNDNARNSMAGPAFHCRNFNNNPAKYHRHLDIANGVMITKASYADGSSYEGTTFFSHANRNLLVISLKNTSKSVTVDIDVQIHDKGFEVKRDSDQKIIGKGPDAYTKIAWAAHLSKPMQKDKRRVTLKPGETLTMRHTFAVHWHGDDILKRAEKALELKKDLEQLMADNEKAMAAEWAQTAVLVIPDEEFSKLYYRSIYWMLATSGSEKFLPGEVMFSNACWNMHAFTYGGGGWPVFAYTYIGLKDHAKRMLDWHWKPKAFKANTSDYMPDKKPHETGWVFAHELSTEGRELANIHKKPYYSQRHIQGFAAAFFHRYSEYYPDKKFKKERVWPVLKGTAEFWRAVAYEDKELGGYVLPKYMSVSENSVETSVIDSVMAAKYCLMMAARYADEYGIEKDLAKKWKELNKNLVVPQNDEIYVQYPGLTVEGMNKLAGGYFGYRSPIYLGFPCTELIPDLDAKKVGRTLDHAWELGNKGHNMITFIASWYALADVFYGRGDHALEVMGRNLQCMPWILAENHPDSGHRYNAYYLDSYASYSIIPVKMMVQSWEGVIKPFPAVPSQWKDVEFYNVPAEAGVRVSGKMKDGKVVFVEYTKDGKVLKRAEKAEDVKVSVKRGKVKIK